jgi:hypothetical protein
MDGSATWEVALDIYRDLILTGVLAALLTAVYKFGRGSERLDAGLRDLARQMGLHYEENRDAHEKLYRIVEDIDAKVDSHG